MSANEARLSVALRAGCVLLGLALLATGLFFVVVGAKLAFLHGSAYFLIAGVIIVAATMQFMRAKSSAVVIHGVAFVVPLVWAPIDGGFDFWPLVSRLMLLADFMLLTWPPLRRHEGAQRAGKWAYGAAAVIAVCMGATFAQMFVPHPSVAFDGVPAPPVSAAPGATQKNWNNYGNTPGGNRFVALDQITRDNVKDLHVASTFHMGDIPISPTGNGAEDQDTPLQIGERIYLCTPHNNVIAVDADSGKQIWKCEINAQAQVWNRCRGLPYFDARQSLQQPTVANTTPVTKV